MGSHESFKNPSRYRRYTILEYDHLQLPTCAFLVDLFCVFLSTCETNLAPIRSGTHTILHTNRRIPSYIRPENVWGENPDQILGEKSWSEDTNQVKHDFVILKFSHEYEYLPDWQEPRFLLKSTTTYKVSLNWQLSPSKPSQLCWLYCSIKMWSGIFSSCSDRKPDKWNPMEKKTQAPRGECDKLDMGGFHNTNKMIYTSGFCYCYFQ